MARRNRPEKREVLPDPRYGNETVQRMINKVMLSGKKATAEGIVYGAMEIMEDRLKKPALEMPGAGCAQCHAADRGPAPPRRWRHLPGAHGNPRRPPHGAGPALADRSAARKRSGKTMADKLAGELMDAYQNQGATVKKKEDTHKMAEANRAFAHYRW